eukprot:TRINITY_DN6045_c0_g1_i1.p1 TRINITY_DN6045_c0_g1~~TRINITY_DN6045_c0_g1_i1.p1  ORF type:complete len:150 (-),score=25.11 TRINITY_DN6045_c0_g1_i1:44-493(-)
MEQQSRRKMGMAFIGEFSCWEPYRRVLVDNGNYNNMLASIPEQGYDGNSKGYVFTVPGREPWVYIEPTDYKLTWKSDIGIGEPKEASFWEPLCENKYVALGDYCQTGYEKPKTAAMRCVRRDLVFPCNKHSSRGPVLKSSNHLTHMFRA